MATSTIPESRGVHLRMLERLRQQAGDVRKLTAGLSEEALARRLLPDKWSLKELVCHLHRVQQVFEERVDAMLKEDNPEVEPYDPDEDAELDAMTARPAAAALPAFFSDRERLLTRLEALSPAQWRRRGTHAEFPDYDAHFQIEYMAHHEAHHIYQIFQRRALLGRIAH